MDRTCSVFRAGSPDRWAWVDSRNQHGRMLPSCEERSGVSALFFG